MSASVGIAVITHTAVKLLPRSLPPLLQSDLKPRVLVVNSSSNDGTVDLAREMGAETLIVPRREFNHGATRELARKVLDTDIVVMITPDAVPIGPELIGHLVRPFLEDSKVAVSYARQIPHDGAKFFESFPRKFNYPPMSEIRSASDIPHMGPRVFFCSDSCAAWSNDGLDLIGGFRATLTAEDTIAAAQLVYAGYKIAYVAEAVVKHSHSYSLAQEFKRYFDTGLTRRLNRDLLLRSSSDAGRGAAFLREMLRDLAYNHPHLIFYALAQTAAKYLGYQVGYHAHKAPRSLQRLLSSQDYYWNSSVIGH